MGRNITDVEIVPSGERLFLVVSWAGSIDPLGDQVPHRAVLEITSQMVDLPFPNPRAPTRYRVIEPV